MVDWNKIQVTTKMLKSYDTSSTTYLIDLHCERT